MADLTLIVAATRHMGIGRAGTLPWPQLRSEMAYFSRVTKRAPPSSLNAVIMGRKTWESIPPKFRPLPGRLNVVVSRHHQRAQLDRVQQHLSQNGDQLYASSMEEALEVLQKQPRPLHRIFVIGGAEVYRAALSATQTRRILLTSVKTDFECDTFFPLDLGESDPATREHGWVQRDTSDLEAWTGESDLAGIKEDNDVQFEYRLFERP